MYSMTENTAQRRRARRLTGAADLEALLPHAHALSWYRPGRRVTVADRMQTRYSYTLTAPPGRDFAPGFRPALSPARMLRMGVFEGKYLNDCVFEFPREWYAAALRAGRLSPGVADPSLNAFGIKSRLSLRAWRRNGWLPAAMGDRDVRGWFQWYCRYYMGRRCPDDERQIRRWKAMRRHIAQIRLHCMEGNWNCRPRQRQALLHWAYDSRRM